METRKLGRTNLTVTRLGAGLAEMGFQLSLKDRALAGRLLNTALDGGITFLDTAACYDVSEELIGHTIAHRRDEYVLATKAGHSTGGYEGQEWTAETVRHSIERSLVRMKTDHIDLVQVHSCGVDVLERSGVIQVLLDAQKAGKTRFVGYSGDNEAAHWAIESGHFDTLQISFNLVDQTPRKVLLPLAKEQGMGVIVKRPIANAVWGSLIGSSRQAYHERARRMADMGPIPGAPEDPILLSLGFTLAHEEVDTAIVGTRNPAHMKANIALVEEKLPLTPQIVDELHRRFDALGDA